MNITICGGGNLGHVCAGIFASQINNYIRVLTSSPEKWSNYIEIIDCNGKLYKGHLSIVSAIPSEAVKNSDLILICLPGFAIHDTLVNLKPYLSPKTLVGSVVSSTGFFFEAFKILPQSQPLFGFQRVPYIARTLEYGHRAELKGYKDSLCVAIENTENKEAIRLTLENLFQTPIKLMNNYYEVSLSNSNPLLHTARLYTLWKDWHHGVGYGKIPMFYEDWTIEAASLYIEMDKELQKLLRIIGVPRESILPVLDYYESKDAETLMNKIRSISAFKGIKAPMRQTDYGYAPDFSSRYFTEDFTYGLKNIQVLTKDHNMITPNIDKVMNWYHKIEQIEK